ncbi:MAG: DUF305 domain-containing protein [Pseudomonadota bacterium]|nr:DUF305 domain-containing protein [Pseudomonadota bacterium]
MKLKHSLLALALAASTLLAVSTSAHEPKPQTKEMKGHDMSKMQGHDMKGQSAGSMELHKAMMAGMKMPMKMSGNVDKDFATMMTMHHQQAVKMSDIYIKHGPQDENRPAGRDQADGALHEVTIGVEALHRRA